VRILQGLSGFEGKDAAGASARLAPLLSRLRREGEPFSLTISSPSGVYVTVDGRTAGARAVAWIVDESVKGVEEEGAKGRLAEARQLIARDPAAFLEMLSQAPFLAWRVSGGLKLEWANAAYVEALETKSLDAAIARNAMIDAQAVEQARRAIDTGLPQEEVRFAVIRGQRRAVRALVFPVAGGAGGMAFDVTEVEEAKAALARSVETHDETLNHIADAIAVFGPDKRLSFHNRAFTEMWGMDPAFLQERPTHAAWLDLLKQKRCLPGHASYPEWRAHELSLHQEVAALPEDLWVLEDGRNIRIARQRHPQGGLLLIFSDVTRESTLRGQFNNQVQVQKAALDKLHEGVAVFGLDGRMKLHNAALQEMWRLTPGDLEGGVDFDRMVALCEPLFHDREIWAAIRARITDPSPAARMEQRSEFTRSDGSIVSYLTRPLPDGATLIAFLDITAQRRVQKALHERAEAVEAADRLKTEFVQNVSVQLRDPLQAIQGFAQVLQQRMTGPLNDRQQEQIDMVVLAAGQLGRLIDNILDLALIEAGGVDLNCSAIDLPRLLSEAAAHAATAAEHTEVQIRVECGPDLGLLHADEKRLRQVLFNLIANAQRHTRPGDSIAIIAAREGAGVRITVSDTGDGMAPATQAAAFDNFASGDGRGAGLGLALVRSFVELHGGWVKLNSAPGVGTTVHCFFPFTPTDAAAPILDLKASMRAAG
jgi:signal transduction histidine kinase